MRCRGMVRRGDDPTASVVVPTFRGRRVLGDCLRALQIQDAAHYETIVVDDGSADGTAQWVRDEFPEVRVVVLPVNQGFCVAVNAGIRAARGEIIALLNDDTIPEPDWLNALIAALGQDRVGFAASRMTRHDQPEILDGAGDAYSRYGLAYRVSRGEPAHCAAAARPVLWASGGASAYRRTLLTEIGLLDEDFGAYYEDVDLGLRAWNAGWHGVYVPSSSVRHVGSFSDAAGRSVTLTTRNSLLVIAKHWPRPLLLRNAHFLAYGQMRNAAWAIRNGHARAWWRGARLAMVRWHEVRGRHGPISAGWVDGLAREHPFGRSRVRRR